MSSETTATTSESLYLQDNLTNILYTEGKMQSYSNTLQDSND